MIDRYWKTAGACLLLSAMLTGCGGTQVAAPNRKLLASLQTAVSAKRPDWLAETSKQLVEKRASGEVSADEFQALNAIITKAQSGDWKGAQKDVFALSESQQPTSEDLANVRDRKPKQNTASNTKK